LIGISTSGARVGADEGMEVGDMPYGSNIERHGKSRISVGDTIVSLSNRDPGWGMFSSPISISDLSNMA